MTRAFPPQNRFSIYPCRTRCMPLAGNAVRDRLAAGEIVTGLVAFTGSPVIVPGIDARCS